MAGGKLNGYAHVADAAADTATAQPVQNGATAANGHAPAENTGENGNGAQNGCTRLSDVVSGWALVSYGTVQSLGRRSPSCDPDPLPRGEQHPPAEFWIRLYLKAPPDERQQIAERAASELQAWRRRDPELNQIKTETLDDLKRRIIEDGEGWSPKDVALAMRCTPTLVRHAREEAERDPEHGRPDSSLAHARQLRADGLSLRQIATLTGIPKSTLADNFR